MSLTTALDKLNALSIKAKTEVLDAQEQAEFEALSSALEQFELPSSGRKTTPDLYNPTNKVNFRGPTGQEFRTPSGQVVKAYKQNDLFQTETSMAPGEAGEMIRALLIGSDRLPAGFTKIQNSHGSDPTGSSYMVPTVLSKQLWDLARSKSVAMSSGCQSIPLSGGNMTFVRTLTDVTPTWRGLSSNSWLDINTAIPAL